MQLKHVATVLSMLWLHVLVTVPTEGAIASEQRQQQQPTTTTTTTIKYIGHTKTPIVILDNVLSEAAYVSLRDNLRSRTDFFEGHANNVNFPGKVARLDRAIVDPFLDALGLAKNDVGKIYPSVMFNEQRAHARGFASILCNPGWIHNDYMDTQHYSKHGNVIAPAAVFYIGFDGIQGIKSTESTESTESIDPIRHVPPPLQTGTAFYREKQSKLERVSAIGNQTLISFCLLFPESIACSNVDSNETFLKIDYQATSSAPEPPPQRAQEYYFEEIDRVVGRPNRMVLYPQDLLHNAWVEKNQEGDANDGISLPCSAKTGRLAISLFFLSRKGGLEIVDALENRWKEQATQQISGVADEYDEFGFLGHRKRAISDNEKARGNYVACPSFTKGTHVHWINVAGCFLNVTTTVRHKETLRIKGFDGVNHPELYRGGKNAPVGTAATDVFRSVYARHFVLEGTSKLMLVNIKLSGAWVGNVDEGCRNCGYCRKTGGCTNCGAGCCPGCKGTKCRNYQSSCLLNTGTCTAQYCTCQSNCNTGHKGGAILITSASSITVLVDVVFESNMAFDGSQNIFSAAPTATLYVVSMSIPSYIRGIRHYLETLPSELEVEGPL